MNLVPEEITVLVVDDDAKFCDVIYHYLSEDPAYTIITAGSGQEALNILEKQQVSAIIADYQMPEMDGLDLLRYLRHNGNTVPFIIFTGQGCESVAIQALNEGADFYLVKGEDPGPQFLVLRKNLHEIIARREADEALRVSEAQNRRMLSLLRATFDATEDGILVETNDGDIALYNERLLQLLHFNADSVTGKKRMEMIRSLKPELIDYKSTCNEEKYLIGDTRDKTYNLLVFADGRVIETHVRPQICEGVQIGRVWSYHDITVQKEAEENLEKYTQVLQMTVDALHAANTKLQLLSDVTRHDILNQVHIIFNYLDLVTTEHDPDLVNQYLLEIEHAMKIINRQIQFTRSYQDLGVNSPMWQNIHTIIQKLHCKSITINNKTEGLLIHADPLLSKVFENLLDNSFRHGTGVSEVTVSYARDTHEGIILIWSDDGKGISKSEKEKIFEKGYGKNTGFGLFLIKEILALSRITIRETGMTGEGACFEMRIPKGSYKIISEYYGQESSG